MSENVRIVLGGGDIMTDSGRRKREIREETIDEINFILSDEENIRNIITDYVSRMDSVLRSE